LTLIVPGEYNQLDTFAVARPWNAVPEHLSLLEHLSFQYGLVNVFSPNPCTLWVAVYILLGANMMKLFQGLFKNGSLHTGFLAVFVCIGSLVLTPDAKTQDRPNQAGDQKGKIDLSKYHPAKHRKILAETNNADYTAARTSVQTADVLAPDAIQANPVIYAYNFSNDHIVSFLANSPGTYLTDVPLQGLNTAFGESLVAIDFRPADGLLYAIASDQFNERLVTVNLTTGQLTQIGASRPAGEVFFGLDFNPVVDLIREVTHNPERTSPDRNWRISPTTGAVVGMDAALAYVAGDPSAGQNPAIVHVAYTRNTPGATSTTLFGIDAARDTLVRIGGVGGSPSPNTGQLTTIGPLGVNTTSSGGFDIQQGTDLAYAALRVGGVPQLYRINLATGQATLIGEIGPSGTDRIIDGLSIQFGGGASAASADLSISKTNNQTTYTPGTQTTYTITVRNNGPDPVVGATVTDNFSSSFSSTQFTCTGSGGATCPANGTGNIQALVDLPVGSSLTFTVVANISATATGNLTNTATIATPTGVVDTTGGNNSATDTDTLTPTAAGVSVSGRVMAPDGRALRGSRVIITDSNGVSRSVLTNSFGMYKFDDIPSGDTYVMRVTSNLYRFSARTIQVSDSLSDVDFVGVD
jgi:uncharacterized repeat protein (TIGR01451 family)